jgi:hypothetical protein
MNSTRLRGLLAAGKYWRGSGIKKSNKNWEKKNYEDDDDEVDFVFQIDGCMMGDMMN